MCEAMDPLSSGGDGREGVLGQPEPSNNLFQLQATSELKFTLANINIFYAHQDVAQLRSTKESK